MLEDTIIAISTPPGCGALGIVRLSGHRALSIARRFFKSRGRGRTAIPGNRPVLGYINDPQKKESFEEALLTFFPAPRSYTKENVVEISCHGSPVILEEVVRLGVQAGARLANPGEFTLRAYLNGRLDILQAEAVNDLIRAASLKQAGISFRQLEGGLSRKISLFRRQIVDLLSRIEAGIEFPEENLAVSPDENLDALNRLIESLERLISSYKAGRTLSEGLTLAITGKTNVGKSTLFNALLDRNRAIVTPYPGTTRDYLRENLVIQDSIFHLVDMAGLGKPSHPVDKEGIRRGQRIAAEADGILLVLDASRREGAEDVALLKKMRGKNVLVLFNKIDRPAEIRKERLQDLIRDFPQMNVSALKRTNLNKLREKIHSLFVPSMESQEDIILHARQKILLDQAAGFLRRAASFMKEGVSDEISAEELRKALRPIGELTGEIQMQDVIDKIFSRFCVGK